MRMWRTVLMLFYIKWESNASRKITYIVARLLEVTCDWVSIWQANEVRISSFLKYILSLLIKIYKSRNSPLLQTSVVEISFTLPLRSQSSPSCLQDQQLRNLRQLGLKQRHQCASPSHRRLRAAISSISQPQLARNSSKRARMHYLPLLTAQQSTCSSSLISSRIK